MLYVMFIFIDYTLFFLPPSSMFVWVMTAETRRSASSHSPHPLKPNKLPKFHVHFRPPPARSGQNYFKPKLLEFTEKNGQCKK